MKTLVLLLLILFGVKSHCDDIPQHKIDQAYEEFRQKPIDQNELSKVQFLSSSVIYKELLNANFSPSGWKKMRIITLMKRQDDLTLEIRKTLSDFPLTIDTMGKLTSLASLVSPEFEAEIANRILEHPSSREFDEYFMSSDEFRNHFRTEPALLRSALTRLLSEDRIKMNSESKKKWEATILRFESLQEQRNKLEPTDQSTKTQSNIVTELHRESRNFNDDNEFTFLLWIVGAFVLLGVFVLFIKGLKSKSER